MRLIACIVAVVTLCSCGIPVPNPEGCLQLTRGDASCRKLFTDDTREIPRHIWEKEKIGQICYKPSDVGEIIKFIETVCNRGQNCVSDWEARLDQSLDNMRIKRK